MSKWIQCINEHAISQFTKPLNHKRLANKIIAFSSINAPDFNQEITNRIKMKSEHSFWETFQGLESSKSLRYTGWNTAVI